MKMTKMVAAFVIVLTVMLFVVGNSYKMVNSNTMYRSHHHNQYQSILSMKPSSSSSSSSSTPSPSSLKTSSYSSVKEASSSRIQNIKDVFLQRQIMKDITAAEFAVKVVVKKEEDKAKIDYNSLLLRLEKSTELLMKRGDSITNKNLLKRIEMTKNNLSMKLSSSASRGDSTISDSDSSSIADMGYDNMVASSAPKELEVKLKGQQQLDKGVKVKELRESLSIIVREDGTVDWDGAITTGKEVAKFGTELWERLNGRDENEGVPSFSDLLNPVQVAAPESKETTYLNDLIVEIRSNISDATTSRDKLKDKLLYSLRDSNANAVPPDDLIVLKKLDTKSKYLSKCLNIVSIDLDVERICVYLQQELETSIEPSDQKIFIAEIALIEKQLISVISVLNSNNNNNESVSSISRLIISMLAANGDNDDDDIVDKLTLIDDDELDLISIEVNDLKNRLGLVTSTGTSMDWGSLGVIVRDNIAKLNEGLRFYGDGTKLLFNDIQYGWRLLIRATQGYTLKPREVNTVRRTGKDLLTLIPFTIILIIPLSPVGHVLVFSFIQRFFPDFFPSCYTEKRLNLRRLFSEIEYKDDNEFLILNRESGNSSGSGNSNSSGNSIIPSAIKKMFNIGD